MSDTATKVIRVTAATTYRIDGDDTPSLDDIAVGDVVGARGRLNSDGSLTATAVVEGRLKGGPGGFGGPDDKGGFGGHCGPKAGVPDGANPNATPAPSASGTASSS